MEIFWGLWGAQRSSLVENTRLGIVCVSGGISFSFRLNGISAGFRKTKRPHFHSHLQWLKAPMAINSANSLSLCHQVSIIHKWQIWEFFCETTGGPSLMDFQLREPRSQVIKCTTVSRTSNIHLFGFRQRESCSETTGSWLDAMKWMRKSIRKH